MRFLSIALTVFAIALLAAGCVPSDQTKVPGTSGQTDQHDDHDHGDHDHGDHTGHDHGDHATEGPHGGHLIELGHDHEFHAELVDDHKAEVATIHILDGNLKPVPIEAGSVNLILTLGNQSQAFLLKPEGIGLASEFRTLDKDFLEMVDNEEVKGKLRVTIQGTPYTGSFSHDAHDHAGHDHEH